MEEVWPAIDFVLPWVDGGDPGWQKERDSWRNEKEMDVPGSDANAECRYRGDHELLRYWFRAVEQFAPWVRRIHFVTCGQKPEWLDEKHPQLNLVQHRDFIPDKYLPTFNSRVIEWNCHRIEGLSERFVLFNDDNFLLRPVEPAYFFHGADPVLVTDLRYPGYIGYGNWSRVLFNDYCLLIRCFDFRGAIWQHRRKWFSVADLGWKRSRQNLLCYLANKTIPVHMYGHLAHPLLKSVQQEIWEACPQELDQSCACRFRSDLQVNQYLICAWMQAKGCFYPAHEKNLGRHFNVCPDYLDEVVSVIREQRVPQVCVNDSELNALPERSSEALLQAFASILPRKSSFERN